MKILAFVVITLLAATKESFGRLDFSQFYLPPCCYTSPESIFSGYALPSEKIGVTSKREVTMQQVPLVEPSDLLATTNLSVQNKPGKDVANGRIRLYSLIVPIRDENFEQLDSNSLPPSNMERVYVSQALKRNIRQLKKNSESRKSFQNDKIENSGDQMEPRMGKNYEKWEPKKIKSLQLQSYNYNLQSSASENESLIKSAKKLPSSWAKYLRRALYQSVTNGQGINLQNGDGSDYGNTQTKSRSKIRFPDTWKSIKKAELQYVDKMSQISTTPRASLYLPPAEGPIVSGVLVNSHDGNLHIRVASELHILGSILDPNCRCYLMGPGEILIAYWSVSRIFKENGQPALQYLVHPLPYSVPTPPDFRPLFSNGEVFFPSPIDPLNKFQGNLEHQNYIGTSSIEAPYKGTFTPQKHTLRNPKRVSKLSTSENVPQNAQPIPMIQQAEPQGGSPIFFENNQQFPPEFLQQYQAAVQNYFNQNINPNQNNIYSTIPYTDLNMNYPVNYDAPVITDNLYPQQLPLVNTHLPFQGNVNPTALPINEVQISKPQSSFPNSIQDIISPVVNNGAELTQDRQQVPPQGNFPVHQQGQLQIPPEILQGHQQFPLQPGQFQIPHMQLPFLFNYPYHHPVHSQYFNLNIPNQGNNLDSTQKNQNIRKENNTKTENISYDNKNLPESESFKPEHQRPEVISNILDNEKQYYPIRQPQKSGIKYFEKYYLERGQRLGKNKLFQDINSKGGYILDF